MDKRRPDPLLPRLETEERRRRGRLLFRHDKIPLRMVVPNFFTVLSLCAGLTAIRMAIEQRPDMAIALIVVAALLDGVDGRLARALKAQSKFGAELDSLADFVNFGVAPAFLIFNWGLGSLKSLGWICVMIFALASALRLARFNVAMEDERPKWQAAYFIGMPTPRKERFLHQYRDTLGVPFIMGVGGGIDVLAGHVRRAPQGVQRAGLEWLYRTWQEPRRMWWRYASTNAVFAGLLGKAMIARAMGRGGVANHVRGGHA